MMTGENQSSLRQVYSIGTLSTKNPTFRPTALGLNPDLRGDTSATECLNTAVVASISTLDTNVWLHSSVLPFYLTGQPKNYEFKETLAYGDILVIIDVLLNFVVFFFE
jgi:hypothetical protein